MTFQNRLFLLPALVVFAVSSVSAGVITDGFEGASISPIWTITGPGNAPLTTASPNSGSQSVRLQPVSTFPWFVTLTHDFGSQQTGTVSVYSQTDVLCCGSAAALEIDDNAGFTA